MAVAARRVVVYLRAHQQLQRAHLRADQQHLFATTAHAGWRLLAAAAA